MDYKNVNLQKLLLKKGCFSFPKKVNNFKIKGFNSASSNLLLNISGRLLTEQCVYLFSMGQKTFLTVRWNVTLILACDFSVPSSLDRFQLTRVGFISV